MIEIQFNTKRLSKLLALIILLFVIIGLQNCKKDEDYRDSFIGAYQCNVMEQFSDINGRDTIMYWIDTVYVSKADEPDNITILGSTGFVNTNGELQIDFDSWGHGLIAKFTTNKIKMEVVNGGHGFTSIANYDGTKK